MPAAASTDFKTALKETGSPTAIYSLCVSPIVDKCCLNRHGNVGTERSGHVALPRPSWIAWPLPPVTLNPVKGCKPASLHSLMIAFIAALVFVLPACEQMGSSTPGGQSGTADEPTIASERTVQEMTQAPPGSTHGPREAARIANGRRPSSGDTLSVTFLDVGQGSSA